MFPNPQTELALLRNYRYVIAIDEVGRGALAGPVCVGATIVDLECLLQAPEGVRDSKLLSPKRREELAPKIKTWAPSQVGYASVAEIESLGITKSLALAASRAIGQSSNDAVVLLDGNQNWLADQISIPVEVRVKADRDCISVAAASIIAKVERDELMARLAAEYPQYGWASNVGYSSPDHISAIREFGPSSEHRKSWLTRILGAPEPLF